jgi:hypothetical protein
VKYVICKTAIHDGRDAPLESLVVQARGTWVSKREERALVSIGSDQKRYPLTRSAPDHVGGQLAE